MSENNNFLSGRVVALLEALGVQLRKAAYQKYNAIIVEGTLSRCSSPYEQFYEEIIGIKYKGQPALYKVLEGSLSAKDGSKFKIAIKIDPKDFDPTKDKQSNLMSLTRKIEFIIQGNLIRWGDKHPPKTNTIRLYDKVFDPHLHFALTWKVKLSYINFDMEKDDYIAQVCKKLVDYIIHEAKANKKQVYKKLISFMSRDLHL